MTGLDGTRDAYNRIEIEEIGWISTADNISDVFIKRGNISMLQKFMRTGCSEQVVSKWVVCDQVTEKQKNEISCLHIMTISAN